MIFFAVIGGATIFFVATKLIWGPGDPPVKVDIIAAIERGFVAYSSGTANIPPVGELQSSRPLQGVILCLY